MRLLNMTPTDARLVALAQAGDRAAFGELVHRHVRACHAVALARLSDGADAEDVCQDAFVTALERLDECRQADRFGAWLLQIVRNRALDVRRRQQVRLASPLDAARARATGHDPSVDAERAELRGRLLEALQELPPTQREVLLLFDLEGWLHREIAEKLDLPEGTVRSHLSHARRRMRAHLERDAEPERTDG